MPTISSTVGIVFRPSVDTTATLTTRNIQSDIPLRRWSDPCLHLSIDFVKNEDDPVTIRKEPLVKEPMSPIPSVSCKKSPKHVSFQEANDVVHYKNNSKDTIRLDKTECIQLWYTDDELKQFRDEARQVHRKKSVPTEDDDGGNKHEDLDPTLHTLRRVYFLKTETIPSILAPRPLSDDYLGLEKRILPIIAKDTLVQRKRQYSHIRQ